MTEAYLLVTGKALPSVSSSKYARLFGYAKKIHRDFQTVDDADWDSDYQLVTAGTVTATDEFDLDEEIVKLSKREGDRIYVLCTDGTTKIPYTLVATSELQANQYKNAVALQGQALKFSRVFTSDEQAFGGTIYAPAHVKYDEITSVSDDVLVDDVSWFSATIGYFYCLPDARYHYRADDLLAESNRLMRAMTDKNGGNESTQSDVDYFASAIGDGEC